eukprot:TRINITY_DN26030_c0_g2_i1.p1 TRINITY_DN26030_c0_g2~~TRINITY_DN26030_c0_g2_i1.p1  ORF type:complete len:504 (+),score=131.26 TRINITY_DN26030_c0_g2_i1:255-1766(+)
MAQTPMGSDGEPLKKFDDLALSEEGKKAMKDGFGYEFVTEVQARTFGPITNEHDLVVRAKTGAGKTLSFLLPSFERMVGFRQDKKSSNAIDVLVISPVRELSMQIYQEAQKLADYYTGIRAVCMTGGVSWQEDIEILDEAPTDVTILIATPGRLQSHVEKTPGFAERVAHVKILVFDEADQLASDIFRAAAEDIIGACGPAAQRQNLFLSATMADNVMALMKKAVKENYDYVDVVGEDEPDVPEHIVQTYSVLPTEDMTLALWKSMLYAKSQYGEEAKIVVILMTGRIAAYYADAFRKAKCGLDVYEIHARQKQNKRTEASDKFRACTSGILFTSDVSSRGLDYPGVMEVVQIGAPRNRAEYIHRLGRTGRAGKDGRGVLLLHEFEKPFLKELATLELSEATLDGDWFDAAAMPDFVSMDIAENTKAQAYYSRINHVMRNAEDLGGIPVLEIMQEAKRFATSIGATDKDGKTPPITEDNAIKMGLADVMSEPCVNIAADPSPK